MIKTTFNIIFNNKPNKERKRLNKENNINKIKKKIKLDNNNNLKLNSNDDCFLNLPDIQPSNLELNDFIFDIKYNNLNNVKLNYYDVMDMKLKKYVEI